MTSNNEGRSPVRDPYGVSTLVELFDNSRVVMPPLGVFLGGGAYEGLSTLRVPVFSKTHCNCLHRPTKSHIVLPMFF